MSTEQFRDDHGELLALREQLIQAIVARDDEGVASVRWRLCRVLLSHLAREEVVIYAPLIRDGGAAGKVAQTFLDEHGGLSRAFSDHITGWPIGRVTADWQGYERDVRALMQALVTRIASEESHLFPLADGRAQRFAA